MTFPSSHLPIFSFGHRMHQFQKSSLCWWRINHQPSQGFCQKCKYSWTQNYRKHFITISFWLNNYLNGFVISVLLARSNRWYFTPPTVYHLKCKSQLNAPKCLSKLRIYAKVSSLIMSITGQATFDFFSATWATKLSSQP